MCSHSKKPNSKHYKLSSSPTHPNPKSCILRQLIWLLHVLYSTTNAAWEQCSYWSHVRHEVILKSHLTIIDIPMYREPSNIIGQFTFHHCPCSATHRFTFHCLIRLDAYWGKNLAKIEKKYKRSSVLTSLLKAAASSTLHRLPSPTPSHPIASQDRLGLDYGQKPVTRGRKRDKPKS